MTSGCVRAKEGASRGERARESERENPPAGWNEIRGRRREGERGEKPLRRTAGGRFRAPGLRVQRG